MKSLGIVRKIDDLGRVVIPKEVRDTQQWKSGQPMEMFMSTEGLVLRPYGEDREKAEILFALNDLLNSQTPEVQYIAAQTIKFLKKG